MSLFFFLNHTFSLSNLLILFLLFLNQLESCFFSQLFRKLKTLLLWRHCRHSALPAVASTGCRPLPSQTTERPSSMTKTGSWATREGRCRGSWSRGERAKDRPEWSTWSARRAREATASSRRKTSCTRTRCRSSRCTRTCNESRGVEWRAWCVCKSVLFGALF